jgi:hypothetical protein
LERNYFPAFGTPNDNVTDNAKVSRSKQFRHLCFRWGVNHITTTPYYPQASLMERANRNLKTALKSFHHESQNVWDEDLPWISAALNTAKPESTNTTPGVLFLRREIKSPLEARWELPLKHEENNTPSAQSVWAQAYRNLRLARNKVARRYNEKRTPHSFKVGDQVLYRKNVVNSKALNVSGKMQLRWSAPCVITRIVNKNNVLLANPDTGVVLRKAHVSQLTLRYKPTGHGFNSRWCHWNFSVT